MRPDLPDLPDLFAWNPATSTSPEDDFGQLVDELRQLQDAVATADAPAAVLRSAAASMRALREPFEAHAAGESQQPFGVRHDLPARGQTLVPELRPLERTETTLVSPVRFSRFHLGRNGVAHGGMIPMVFDELMGRLAQNLSGLTRTAFLTVYYRSVAYLDRDLLARCRIDRVEGRKRFVTGTLHDGDTLVSEAEGLFIAVRPGAP